MGFLSKTFKKAIGGVSDVLGLSGGYSVDMSEVDEAKDALKKAQAEASKKKKSLFFTKGGVLGDRLLTVGSTRRDDLFS